MRKNDYDIQNRLLLVLYRFIACHIMNTSSLASDIDPSFPLDIVNDIQPEIVSYNSTNVFL